jgi:predicted phosphodiesterase
MLADEFGKVFVPCVVGNHGRHDVKPRMKNKVYDNFEWLIYQFAAKAFKNDPRVTFHIPDGADAQFSVYGKKFLLTHGDQFRGGTGISGIFAPLMLGMARKQKRQNAVQKPFDILMMGHWHQLLIAQGLIVNGSMKGYDEYAYNMNFGFERPQQALFIVRPDGEITFQMPVFCDGFKAAEKKSSSEAVSID